MARPLIFLLCLSVAACSGQALKENALTRNDAIADMIQVDELRTEDKIRTGGTVGHEVITDKYIILSDRKSQYLIEFARRCHELHDVDVTPDVRHEHDTIRARFDTYRGCRISAIYAISPGQAEELLQLGEASGT